MSLGGRREQYINLRQAEFRSEILKTRERTMAGIFVVED